MSFKKRHRPWNKGKELSKEHKEKVSRTLKNQYMEGKLVLPWKGKKRSGEYKRKLSECFRGRESPMKGRKHTEETKKKISLSKKGTKIPKKVKKKMSISRKKYLENHNPKGLFKKGMKPWNKNKKLPELSEKYMGEGNPMYERKPWNYIDGRSKLLGPDRYGDDWDKTRLLIYKRDNYQCQWCDMGMNECKKEYGVALHVHHKIPFMISFDNSLGNLITLCPPCHRKEEARIMKELKKQKVEVRFR